MFLHTHLMMSVRLMVFGEIVVESMAKGGDWVVEDFSRVYSREKKVTQDSPHVPLL